jgi:hypothetical protein
VSQPNNAQIIAEFRKNHGKVGGYFEGWPLLLLHTVGKRSGKPRVNPVVYLRDGNVTWSWRQKLALIHILTGITTSKRILASRSRSETRLVARVDSWNHLCFD